jgi:hypothetical protein
MTTAVSVEPFKNNIIIVRIVSQRLEERASYSRKTAVFFVLTAFPRAAYTK